MNEEKGGKGETSSHLLQQTQDTFMAVLAYFSSVYHITLEQQ